MSILRVGSASGMLSARLSVLLLVVAGGFLVGVFPVGAGTPCDSDTVVPNQEHSLRQACDVLWAVFSGLDDPGVLDDVDNTRAWRMDNPVREWQGTGWTNDRLTSLRLPSEGLSGPLSPRLGELADLVTLELSGNSLAGPIPSELGDLSNLRYLVLGSNQLSGTIPPELGRLTELKNLSLHNNLLTGSLPVQLGALSNLVTLSLHTNQFSGPIPKELGSLSELEFLELGGNRFTGPIPVDFGNLTSLTYVVIHSSDLTGPLPVELGRLTELRQLYLSSNQITGTIPVELGLLTNLEVLDPRKQSTGRSYSSRVGQSQQPYPSLAQEQPTYWRSPERTKPTDKPCDTGT